MTGNVRILLAQIAVFEQQHRAGLNPPVTALAEFFDTARLARLDVEALDRGLVEERRPATPRAPLVLERINDDGVVLSAKVSLGQLARVLLDEMQRADARA